MELSFVIDALKRYFWIVPIFAVLGALPGLVQGRDAEPEYTARAVLLVVPARESRVEISFGGDNDRYISSEIVTMGSTQVAEEVAARLDDGTTADDVTDSTTFVHPPQTDIVQVVVETDDPARSQAIANNISKVYLSRLDASIGELNAPEAERLQDEIDALNAQLAQVDEQIEAAMLPFITPPTDGEGELPPIPAVDQVAPSLSSQKSILLARYTQLLTAQTEFSLDPDLQVASELVQEATLPLVPRLPRSNIFAAVGFIGGAFIGLLVAVLMARLSLRLLGARHAEELVGMPTVGPIPLDRATKTNLTLVLDEPRDAIRGRIDSLCVRVEAIERPTAALTVAVVGVDAMSNSTMLAVAMAGRFATQGLRSVLVDGDMKRRYVTRAFANDEPGLSELVEEVLNSSGALDLETLQASLTSAAVPGVEILGAGRATQPFVLGRETVYDLMSAVESTEVVVVIDAGPILDSSLAVQVARTADVVVLAIPERARAASLEAVMVQVSQYRNGLVPVITRRRRSILSRRRPAPATPVAAEPPAVDDPDTTLAESNEPESVRSG